MMFTAVLCGFLINSKLTGHFRINNRVNPLNSIAVQKMKLLAVVLVVALRLQSVTVQADEEVKKKFKDDLEPISKECLELHPLKEEDKTAMVAFEIPPNEEGKCFAGCVYSRLGMIEGNKFEPTKFKERVKDWLQKYPEKYQKVEGVLDTCTKKVAEANPNGGTECALTPSILECFHSHPEETDSFRKFLASVYGS
ncbi:hypothetical protein B7P43_G02241 [Cryptotermes secundus]|uniref:Uncharacterized protein n=1 Tax=Cryptotermes secundus TaxID=105785 RepID=A0A2J7PNF4_9NEOP|nr:uncharacterized protein LOC111872823 [Cryptotermes secundus]PNF17863.1 hypothetical protein B7P43_G02241 [Cryptotermes secundus]